MYRNTILFAAALALGCAGCSDDTNSRPDGSSPDAFIPDGALPDAEVPDSDVPDAAPPADECPTIGATECSAGLVRTCEQSPTRLVWGSAEDCGATSICRTAACEEATETQLAQASVMADYANEVRNLHGYHAPIDFDAMIASARRAIFLGDESVYHFNKAVYSIFKGVRQGHGAIAFGPSDYSACFDPAGDAVVELGSFYGVCARSAGDSSIVTFAPEGNPLGLSPGDRVVRVQRDGEVWESPGFLDRIGEEPICDGGQPSDSSRADHAATHIFGIINEGDTIDVMAPDGTMRSVAVPARGRPLGCFDPFRRDERREFVTSRQRPDGVVVLIVPTFGNHPTHPFPTPLDQQGYRDWNARAIEIIDEEIGQYEDVTGLVWDIRGNGGGSAEYSMGLLGSLGTTAGGIGNCYARVPESNPAEFSAEAEYPFPYPIFVEQPLPSLSYTGPQAIVSDGIAVSAADWFLYRASKLGIPIVGHAGRGAYGYRVGPSFVQGAVPAEAGVHNGISWAISGARCVDAENGQPIEGVAPIDMVVDFDPADLAMGIDTQLEAAVAQVLAP